MELKPEDFGLTQEEAKNIKDMNPTLDLGKITPKDKIEVEIVSEKPELIKYKDKVTNEEIETQSLTVIDQSDMLKKTLWLSSASLKREIFKIFQDKNVLKGLKIIITVREYKHVKYGDTRAYSCQTAVEKSE